MPRLLTTIAILVLIAAPAWAQFGPDKGQKIASAGIGISLPMGDFGDAANTGFLFGAGYGILLSPQMEIGGEFGYHMYGVSDEYYLPANAPAGTEVDVSFSILSFGGYAKYLLAPEYKTIYLKGGLGFYNAKASGDVTHEGDTHDIDESATDLGIAVGGGYQTKGDGNTGYFVEATLNHVMSEGDSTQFINLRGGISFLFGD
jgi:hypothetical protein